MKKNLAARRFATISALLVATAACAPSAQAPPEIAAVSDPTPIENPSAPDSGMPGLSVGSDGRIHMSWVEPTESGHRVAAATLSPDGSWSATTTAVTAADLFVNWADFPSVIELRDGTLASHWLQSLGEESMAYGVMLARTDSAGTWGASWQAHDDSSATEHGFTSLVAEPDGGFSAVWLDGRAFVNSGLDPHSGAADMSLRSRRYAADGTPGPEQVLDLRICDCCQTGAAYLGDALVVVYRDRSPDEIRDIWMVRRTEAGWSEPSAIADDGWMIPGCPVNGPVVVSTGGDAGAVVWFSLVDGTPEVKVAFTDDQGASFSDPILVERGTVEAATLGRVGLASLGDGSVVATWLSQIDRTGEIRYRRITPDGMIGPVQLLALTGAARSSGFPQVTATSHRVFFAWTDTSGDDAVIRTASLPLRSLVTPGD